MGSKAYECPAAGRSPPAFEFALKWTLTCLLKIQTYKCSQLRPQERHQVDAGLKIQSRQLLALAQHPLGW